MVCCIVSKPNKLSKSLRDNVRGRYTYPYFMRGLAVIFQVIKILN